MVQYLPNYVLPMLSDELILNLGGAIYELTLCFAEGIARTSCDFQLKRTNLTIFSVCICVSIRVSV